MKTIDDLNKRWWYRATKVVFILFFVIVIAILALIAVDGNQIADTELSRVTCGSGSSSSIQNLERIYGDRYSAYTFCGSSMYNYDWKYKVDWENLTNFIFWSVIVVAGLAFALRGSFYYIVLGAFNPPKS